jgi:hypothetical protein
MIFETDPFPYGRRVNERCYGTAFPDSGSGLIPGESTRWMCVVFNRSRDWEADPSFQIVALSGYYSASLYRRAMPLPKQGDTVKVTLLNRETIEGVVEWVDGNGLWVKGAERSRWVPLEAFTAPHDSHPIDAKEEQSSA